jgi:hypothetical protein
MTHRTNFTLTTANYEWLRRQAPSERGMSKVIDTLIEKERDLRPIEARLEHQVRRLETLFQPPRQAS